MKVRELRQEMALWDDDLEVYLPIADPLGVPTPAHEWEYIYEGDDYEGNGKPIGVLLEAHVWWRNGH
jgi:hypothetical protein